MFCDRGGGPAAQELGGGTSKLFAIEIMQTWGGGGGGGLQHPIPTEVKVMHLVGVSCLPDAKVCHKMKLIMVKA